jgi:hypothetical protein
MWAGIVPTPTALCDMHDFCAYKRTFTDVI